MPSAGFEPKILASERPQTHALDCAITGIGSYILASFKFGRPAPTGRHSRADTCSNDDRPHYQILL